MDINIEINEKTVEGIRVVHVKSSNLLAYVAFHCLSGSFLENEKEQGLSHYLEHMFFKGTDKRNCSDVVRDAARLGANSNAFTSELDTCYYLKCPSARIDPAIELLSDMLFNSKFPEEELEKEKTVIQEERKSYDQDHGSFFFQTMEKNILNFQFGHPIIGTEETINSVSRKDLIKFRENNYTKDNIIFLVIGNTSSEDVFNSCEKYFAGNDLEDSVEISYDDDYLDFSKDLYFEREGIQQAFLSMAYPSLPIVSKKSYLEECFQLYLGGGLYGVLPQRIREELGYCYYIGSFDISKGRDQGCAVIYSQLNFENVDNTKSEIVLSLRDIESGNLSEDVFNCCKAQLLTSICKVLDAPDKMARSVALKCLFGKKVNLKKSYNKISKLTFKKFSKYAKKRSSEILDNYCWIVMAPKNSF